MYGLFAVGCVIRDLHAVPCMAYILWLEFPFIWNHSRKPFDTAALSYCYLQHCTERLCVMFRNNAGTPGKWLTSTYSTNRPTRLILYVDLVAYDWLKMCVCSWYCACYLKFCFYWKKWCLVMSIPVQTNLYWQWTSDEWLTLESLMTDINSYLGEFLL